jgi:hypothetical protein
VDLLVSMLKNAIRDLLARKRVRGRVLDKVNARGEPVIGVIIEGYDAQPPPPERAEEKKEDA